MKLIAEWHARRDSDNQGVARSSPRKQCSPALHFIVRVKRCLGKKCGTPGGTRTPDLLLRRQLLYPAELLAHFYGAGDGNRTRVSSLEGWCSTIELHPHSSASRIQLVNSSIVFSQCQELKQDKFETFVFPGKIRLAVGENGRQKTAFTKFPAAPSRRKWPPR